MTSRFRKMSPRQATVAWGVLGIGTLSLGVWVLATGSRLSGVIWLVVGFAWSLLAFLGWRKPARVFRNPERA